MKKTITTLNLNKADLCEAISLAKTISDRSDLIKAPSNGKAVAWVPVGDKSWTAADRLHELVGDKLVTPNADHTLYYVKGTALVDSFTAAVNAQTETETQPKAEPKTESKPQPKTKTQTQPKAEPKTQPSGKGKRPVMLTDPNGVSTVYDSCGAAARAIGRPTAGSEIAQVANPAYSRKAVKGSDGIKYSVCYADATEPKTEPKIQPKTQTQQKTKTETEPKTSRFSDDEIAAIATAVATAVATALKAM